MSKYEKYFIVTKRLTSQKPIAIVRGEMFEDLIHEVLLDDKIDRAYKAFFVVCLSGGLRVSEGLNLKKTDFIEDGEDLYASCRVLKKRDKEEFRYIRIHPIAASFVIEFLASKIGKPFHWVESTCLRKIKRYFMIEGICNHSLRHSAISYYLFEEGLSREATAKLIHINQKTIDVYSHLDERKLLKTMFRKQG